MPMLISPSKEGGRLSKGGGTAAALHRQQQDREPFRKRPPTSVLTPLEQKSADINFNSPIHESSQDGSFIQDEDNMQLILDYGSQPGDLTTVRIPAPKGIDLLPSGGIITRSWLNKQTAKWATNFDMNIAELDFDNFTTEDILQLGAAAGAGGQDYYWDDGVDEMNNRITNSLDLSLSRSRSLFSESSSAAAMVADAVVSRTIFMSTDSLMNMSQLQAAEAHLKAACVTKKEDYMLTFDMQRSAMQTSVLVPEESAGISVDYKDAQLSGASEYVSANSSEQDYPGSVQDCFTTWGRIRRSYEMERLQNEVTTCGANKSTSLPNLMDSPNSSLKIAGGEKMLSHSGGDFMPIFDVQTMSTSSHKEPDGKSEGFSLLKMFQARYGVISPLDRLQIPSALESADSSGYVTGQGSSQQHRNEGDHQSGDTMVSVTIDVESGEIREDSPLKEVSGRAGFMLRNDDDWEYGEYITDDGRYIDMNHNEIGFVPPSTKPYQSVGDLPNYEPAVPLTLQESPRRRHQSDIVRSPRKQPAPAKPPRTYETDECLYKGDFGVDMKRSRTEVQAQKDSTTQIPVYVVNQSVQTAAVDTGQLITVVTTSIREPTTNKPIYVTRTINVTPPQSPGRGLPSIKYQSASTGKLDFGANFDFKLPDLSFMKLPFQIPPLFPVMPQFPLAFYNLDPNQASMPAMPILGQNFPSTNLTPAGGVPKFAQVEPPFPITSLPEPPKTLYSRTQTAPSSSFGDRCAGPGGSIPRDSGLGNSGPAHVQDWDSLSLLLPKEVVQACSFFKAHSNLLQSGAGHHPGRLFGKFPTADQMTNSIDKPAKLGPQRHSKRLLAGQHVKLRQRRAPKRPRPLSEPVSLSPRIPKVESIPEEDEYGLCRSDCHRSNFHHHHHYHHHYCCQTVPVCLQKAPYCANLAAPDPPSCYHHCQKACCREDMDEIGTSSEDDFERSCAPPPRPVSYQHYPQPYHDPKANGEIWYNNCHYDENCSMADSDEYELTRPEIRSEYRLKEPRESNDLPSASFHSVPYFKSDEEYYVRKAQSKNLSLTINNVEAKEIRACATCYRVRSPSVESIDIPAQCSPIQNGEFYCDCKTSEIQEEKEFQLNKHVCPGRKSASFNGKSRDEPLLKSVNYESRKTMVRNVAKAADALVSMFTDSRTYSLQQFKKSSRIPAKDEVSSAVRDSLCPAIAEILGERILPGKSIWSVVQAAAVLGPATKSIHELVAELTNSANAQCNEISLPNGEIATDLAKEKENSADDCSLQFEAFVIGLLNLHSLDCWLSYLVLKDRILREYYEPEAFLALATSRYKHLFTELVVSVQPLSLLPFERLDLRPPFLCSDREAEPMEDSLVIAEQVNVAEEQRKEIAPEIGTEIATTVTFQPQLNFTFTVDIDPPVDKVLIDGINTGIKLQQRSEMNGDELGKKYSLIPAPLPNDSRIPKSSSVPSKLATKLNGSGGDSKKSQSQHSALARLASPSRIPRFRRSVGAPALQAPPPQSLSPEPMSTSLTESEATDEENFTELRQNRYVSAIDNITGDRRHGYLTVKRGETMQLLNEFDRHLQVKLGDNIGMVPRNKVTFVTFL